MKKDIILLGTALGSATVLAILCAIWKRRSKATYIDHISDNDNGSDSDSPVLDTDHFPDKENEQLENKNQDPEENCVSDSEKEEEMFDFSDTIPEEELESLYGIENFDVPLDECDENVAANKSTTVDQNDSIKANIWLEDGMPSFRSETDEFAFWREAIENAQKRWKSEIYSVSFPKVMRYITRKGFASASGFLCNGDHFAAHLAAFHIFHRSPLPFCGNAPFRYALRYNGVIHFVDLFEQGSAECQPFLIGSLQHLLCTVSAIHPETIASVLPVLTRPLHLDRLFQFIRITNFQISDKLLDLL